MSKEDIYATPQSEVGDAAPATGRGARRFVLAGATASVVAILSLFAATARLGTPDRYGFLLDPGFLFTVAACSLVAGLALYPLRRSPLIVAILLAPLIGLGLFVAVLALLNMLAP
jgi:hypothetical protein